MELFRLATTLASNRVALMCSTYSLGFEFLMNMHRLVDKIDPIRVVQGGNGGCIGWGEGGVNKNALLEKLNSMF